MVSASILLVGILSSPLKSILLPVNIPMEFNFESVQSIDPTVTSNGGNPYEIVVLGHDRTQLLRLKPEEAHNTLQIMTSDLTGSAKLMWGDSNSLNFYGVRNESFIPFKIVLAGPLALAGNEPTILQTVGTEVGFQGLIGMDDENERESVMLSDFKWPLTGRSIPIVDGKAETGSWMLTSKPDSPVNMIINDDQSVTIKYLSFFTSPNLYAEDLTTGQIMPIAFATTISGSIKPSPSELPSYINSQIYIQVFGWLIPVAALMAIIWLDDRYRQRIRKMLKREVPAE